VGTHGQTLTYRWRGIERAAEARADRAPCDPGLTRALIARADAMAGRERDKIVEFMSSHVTVAEVAWTWWEFRSRAEARLGRLPDQALARGLSAEAAAFVGEQVREALRELGPAGSEPPRPTRDPLLQIPGEIQPSEALPAARALLARLQTQRIELARRVVSFSGDMR
jgi:hypothetical protein